MAGSGPKLNRALIQSKKDAMISYEGGAIGIGYKLRGMAGRYINLSDDQIQEGFREMFTKSLQGA